MSTYLQNLRTKIGNQMIIMPSVTGIVRDESGNIFAQRRSDNGKWSLPGGSIYLGETPAEAVVREVWEETGLRVVPEFLWGVFGGKEYRVTYPDGNQVEYTEIVFECKWVGGKLAPNDGESVELRFLTHRSFLTSGSNTHGRYWTNSTHIHCGYDKNNPLLRRAKNRTDGNVERVWHTLG